MKKDKQGDKIRFLFDKFYDFQSYDELGRKRVVSKRTGMSWVIFCYATMDWNHPVPKLRYFAVKYTASVPMEISREEYIEAYKSGVLLIERSTD